MTEPFARVLLADGVKAMRDVHRHQLRNAGLHNVVEATTSQDASSQISRQAFGLIVWALPLDRAFDELADPNATAETACVPIIVLLRHSEDWPATVRRADIIVLRKPVSTDSLKQAAGLLLSHNAPESPACRSNARRGQTESSGRRGPAPAL